MAILLLDTNIIIAVLRGHRERSGLLAALLGAGNLLACSPIIIAEIFAGMRPREEPATMAFLSSLEVLPFTADVARLAGLLKRDYARKGATLSIADTMIASTAIHYSATLVTHNTKDFPMPELVLYPLPK